MVEKLSPKMKETLRILQDAAYGKIDPVLNIAHDAVGEWVPESWYGLGINRASGKALVKRGLAETITVRELTQKGVKPRVWANHYRITPAGKQALNATQAVPTKTLAWDDAPAPEPAPDSEQAAEDGWLEGVTAPDILKRIIASENGHLGLPTGNSLVIEMVSRGLIELDKSDTEVTSYWRYFCITDAGKRVLGIVTGETVAHDGLNQCLLDPEAEPDNTPLVCSRCGKQTDVYMCSDRKLCPPCYAEVDLIVPEAYLYISPTKPDDDEYIECPLCKADYNYCECDELTAIKAMNAAVAKFEAFETQPTPAPKTFTITAEQWRDVLDRLAALENEVKRLSKRLSNTNEYLDFKDSYK